MTAPAFFGALVRAIGLYFAAAGLTGLGWAISPVDGYSPASYILVGTADMLLGAFLLLKADGVVATCYSRDDADDANDD